MNCQVCSLDHTNLSCLLIHYMQTHYTREMYEEMENVVVGKQCKLCGQDCNSRQELDEYNTGPVVATGPVVVTPQKNKFQVSEQPSPIFQSSRRNRQQEEQQEEESQSLLALEQQRAWRSIFNQEDYAALRGEDGQRAGPSYAHVGPAVRGRQQRAKLLGFDCPECADYYRMKLEEGLRKDQILMNLNKCSRHRGYFKPPLMPEKFWDPEIIEGDPEDPRYHTRPRLGLG